MCDSESSRVVKIAWGLLIGLFCWVMTGLEGIRMLSNLGGFPALFLCLAVVASAIRVLANPARYDLLTAPPSPAHSDKTLCNKAPL